MLYKFLRECFSGALIMTTILVLLSGLYVFGNVVYDLFSDKPHEQKTAVGLLHLCFPEGIYKADADPICPYVDKVIVGELNRQQQENGNAK